MRVLFSCPVGYGIVNPMVPLARALVAAGHHVAFATGRAIAPWVERLGFTALPAGAHAAEINAAARRMEPDYPDRLPRDELLRFYLTHQCAQLAAPAMVGDLVAIGGQWRPHLLVHEMSEYAGPVAASVLGIPYVNHSTSCRYPPRELQLAADAVAPLWARWDVDPGPLGGMFRHLYLDIIPPSLQAPDASGLCASHAVRPVPVHVPLDGAPGDDGGVLDWLANRPAQPAVHVSLGTIFNKAPGLLSTIIEGLRSEPLNVVVATGHDVDPTTLGLQPENVCLRKYVAQDVMTRCDAAVCHGGTGTILAALSHGLPVVLVPQAVDQFHNAMRCEAAGAGLWIHPAEFGARSVAAAVHSVLSGRHHDAARRLQREIEEMPPAAEAIGLLEVLAGHNQWRHKDASHRRAGVPHAAIDRLIDAPTPLWQLACLLAPFDSQPVPLHLLEGSGAWLPGPLSQLVSDGMRIEDTAGVLSTWDVARTSHGAIVLEPHAVRAVRCKASGVERRMWVGAALRLLLHRHPIDVTPAAAGHSARLLPLVIAVTNHAEILDAEPATAGSLLARAGVHARARRDVLVALECLERSIAMGVAVHGPYHRVVALRRNNLAALLADMGQVDEAHAQLEQAVAIFDNTHGPERDAAIARRNLARL